MTKNLDAILIIRDYLILECLLDECGIMSAISNLMERPYAELPDALNYALSVLEVEDEAELLIQLGLSLKTNPKLIPKVRGNCFQMSTRHKDKLLSFKAFLMYYYSIDYDTVEVTEDIKQFLLNQYNLYLSEEK